MILSKKASGYHQKEFLCDAINSTPFVHVIWQGIQNVNSTHVIVYVSFELDNAEKILDRLKLREIEFYDLRSLDLWIESIPAYHLTGSAMVEKARKIKSGD